MSDISKLVHSFLAQQPLMPKDRRALQEPLEEWAWSLIHTTRLACAARARHGFQQIEVEQLAKEKLEDTAQYIEDGEMRQELDAASAARQRVLMTVRALVEDYNVLQRVTYARTE